MTRPPIGHAMARRPRIARRAGCSPRPRRGAASPAVTRQAATADGAFLDYAPPPPGGAGALCLVDTGVTANPDTTPGLVAATALDGGTGSDVDPLAHGTIDAATAGGSGQGGLSAPGPDSRSCPSAPPTSPAPAKSPASNSTTTCEASVHVTAAGWRIRAC